MPPQPLFPNSSSARLRNRFSKRLRLWKYTVGLIHFLNFMHVGTNRHKLKLSGSAARAEPNQAQRAVWRHLFELSRAGLRVRRGVTPTGGQSAVAALVKSAKVDVIGYASVSKTHAQVPMEAARIVEPSDEHVVDMLLATDAMGQNELDHGGYGICLTKVSEAELEALRANSEQLGLALSLHDDVVDGMPFPERALTPACLAIGLVVQCLTGLRPSELLGLREQDVLRPADAMGQNELDHGGYGICLTKVSEAELEALRANSEQLGLALNLHDDVVDGMPFSRESFDTSLFGNWACGPVLDGASSQ